MNTFSLVSKPPEASGTFNGLLGAVIAGRSYGESNSSLSFENFAIDDNPDASPRGYNNPAYQVVPHLTSVDPTSYLALSSEAAFRRNPVGTVGYTHDHVAMEYLTHISSMFARWLADYMVLYAAASAQQKLIDQGQFQRLDQIREARYGDNHVSDYLAAVGRLTDGNISFPGSKTLDVDIIHARVMTALSENIGILDNMGYTVGETFARKTIGMGTMPRTGVNTKVVAPSTYDKLICHRWKRLLPLPRAREILRPMFEERISILLSDAVPDSDGFVKLVEGHDELILPVYQADGETPHTFDTLCALIDARPTLTSASYRVSGDLFTESWLNQFYTKGELVEGLLTGTIDPLEHQSILSVLLSNPILDPTTVDDPANPGLNDRIILGPVTGSTGHMSSYNLILQDRVSPITGSIDVYANGSYGVEFLEDGEFFFVPLANGQLTSSLPSGILEIGSCGEATAISWINILRHLNLNYPQRVKQLLRISGRAKRSLPSSANKISAFDQLLAEALANGQRDGYINSPSLAFNATRLTRREQEGPIFAGTLYSDDSTGQKPVESYMASNLNGWDRTDSSDGRYVIDTNGTVINIDGGTFL